MSRFPQAKISVHRSVEGRVFIEGDLQNGVEFSVTVGRFLTRVRLSVTAEEALRLADAISTTVNAA